ncbi:helix-turn-helix domain-containing protein [Pediococcus cellicola]|nr:helix-turn-helix transcriptional regulator [Pediococcus cellicola]GEL14219.1 hypothetical protein PCE01_00210 [Pediococcus cellicola]
MTIYARIQETAKLKNISIRELETKLGFSNGTLSKWIDRANLSKLKKVADYLDVTTGYLLGTEKPGTVDIKNPQSIVMYDGKPIPEEDMETIRRIVEGLRNADKR